jgi:hypothetical protein
MAMYIDSSVRERLEVLRIAIEVDGDLWEKNYKRMVDVIEDPKKADDKDEEE